MLLINTTQSNMHNAIILGEQIADAITDDVSVPFNYGPTDEVYRVICHTQKVSLSRSCPEVIQK